MKTKIAKLLFLPASLLFLELVLHIVLLRSPAGDGIFIISSAAVAVGSLLTLLITLLKKRGQNTAFIVILSVLAVLFSFHMVYYHIFHMFFLWDMLGLAGNAVAFYKEALVGIAESWYMVLAAFVPLAAYIAFLRKEELPKGKWPRIALSALTLAGTVVLVLLLRIPGNSMILRHLKDDPAMCYENTGVVVSTGTDLYHMAFGVKADVIPDVPDDLTQLGKTDVRASEKKYMPKNALPVDFSALIADTQDETIKDMHRYFQSKSASTQNDYTGMFAGKNLIFLTLESFSDKAVSEELTPTLHKMLSEGFVFNNFYNGMWGGSTGTGEYSNITGLFYNSAVCMEASSYNLQPLALGNLFRNAGYSTYSYHNGRNVLYFRYLAYYNFGYSLFKAIDSGLVLERDTWPNSDYLMAKASLDDYLNSDEPFLAYYMTISGHLNYGWTENQMAKDHQAEVDGLDHTELAKGFIATQLEVENCVKYLYDRLEAAGKLEDTVFVMCPDHYPYGLPDKDLADLYGLPEKAVRADLEVYRNRPVIWCASMEEPVVVDVPCAAYDLMPTVANLFGLSFDSRFYAGTDILSDSQHLAIINTFTTEGGNWNWITEEGTYRVVPGEFEKSENCTLATDEAVASYVSKMNNTVARIRKYTYAILDNDYYRYVFDGSGQPLRRLSE